MNGFDDILKNKLGNFKEMPSDEVFLKIRSNYPKPGVKDFLSNYKYYFIAAVSAVIIVTGIILLNQNHYEIQKSLSQNDKIENQDNSQNNEQIVPENSQFVTKPNNKTALEKGTSNLDLVQEPNIEKKETIYTKMFGFSDTVVCGLFVETEFNGLIKAVILPDGLNALISDRNIKLSAAKPGTFTVLYAESFNNKFVKDSLVVTFKNNKLVDVKLSNEIVCPGEDLLVYIKNTNSEPNWNNNFKHKKTAKYTYQISGLSTGENNISFTINQDDCSQTYNKIVTVAPDLNYSFTSLPNICSSSNAKLYVKTEHQNVNYYTLNNTIESKNGVFNELNSGIYTLSINYENGCIVHDTLLIRDSLNLSPYFIAEKDLINKNKYLFRNFTKVDDRGYERNPNVEFIWKVDGNTVSVEDNPSYEFVKQGVHIVELMARLNENCQSIYSETISISGSNFRIPNIFTPNGDGIGDEFVVVYEGGIDVYALEIVNRRGEIVFGSTNILKSWDGKINGNDDAAEGLYFYIIRGEDKFGNKIEQKGSIQLIRH